MGAWLLTIIGPLLIKGLTSLGIGLLTFVGVSSALDGLIDLAQTNYAGMPPAVLGLAAVAGLPECLGMIMGAFVARVGMWAAASATKFFVGGAG